ncbi:hypothetical protein E2C01_021729 [Portunus trituberculatus]|uniref:Uncharacterized protein n=1 Tax=Portunus trituberculatus TaxID=210409 RepID=A0A5B7E5H8_PORTR|nr:hypothetical protein [Portunus trituberculatus]
MTEEVLFGILTLEVVELVGLLAEVINILHEAAKLACKNESNLTREAVTHLYKYQLIGTLTRCHLVVRSNSKFMIITKHINTLTVIAAGRKRWSYTISYKLQVVDYAKKHANRTAAWAFGPPPTEKKKLKSLATARRPKRRAAER